MTYIDQQGLIDRGWEKRLVQLTDKTHTPQTMIDDTIVARHIADAESTVDAYVGKAYTLPLTLVPKVLTKVAVDLAIYFLHGASITKDDPIAIAYRDGMSFLTDVSKGIVKLDDAGSSPQQSGGGQILTAGPDRLFTRDRLSGL